jgi:hypothetical protein
MKKLILAVLAVLSIAVGGYAGAMDYRHDSNSTFPQGSQTPE